MEEGLYNIFGILRVFICLLLIGFLLTLKSERTFSNKLFALFLGLLIIDFNGNWLTSFYVEEFPNFDMFRNTLAFLQLPVFYLYILSLCYSNFKLKAIHVLHIIPLLVVNIMLIPNYYLVNLALKSEFMENILERPEIVFIYIFIHVLAFVYTILIFLTLHRFRKIYLENYAASNSYGYKWLLRLSTLICSIYIFSLVKNILKYSDYGISFIWIKLILSLIILVTICWYLMLALKKPQLFRGIDLKLKSVNERMSGKNDISKIREVERNKEILISFMEKEKPYLDASMTIQDLAKSTNLPIKDLSVLINHHMGQHFFDFTNKFRIEEAMKILQAPSQKNLTILEILYAVGFNSKSSFYTAFKNHSGQTPSQYRKSNSNSTK